MNRRTRLNVGLVVGSGVSLSGCVYSRYFELEWDEEVLLQDGRVIVVQLKHSYERLHQGLTPYGGTILARDTTLTFNAGDGIGQVAQLFMGFQPIFLNQHEGTWYAVLSGSYYGGSRQLPGQDWGELEGPYGQWAIKLVERKWQPMSMSRLPAQFQHPNLLIKKGHPSEHAKFSKKLLTLKDKESWVRLHPYDYADIRLTRPTAASTIRSDSVPVNSLGQK